MPMRRARSIQDIESDPESVVELTLSRMDLEELPELVFACKNLLRLDLSHNRLADLPDRFADLPLLTRLNLQDNLLTELPDSMAKLSQVEQAHLQANQLRSLPTWINEWKAIRSLRLDHNPVKLLPEGLGGCVHLAELSLREAQLQDLPDALFSLEQLNYLDLRYNEFRQLPRKLGGMPALREVLLTGNPVVDKDKEPFLERWLTTFFRDPKRLEKGAAFSQASLDVLLYNFDELLTQPPEIIFGTLESPFNFVRERAVEVLGKILQDPFAAADAPKTVVFAGKMGNVNMIEAREKLELKGFKVRGAISRDPAIVILGARPGRKLQKALDRQLPMATWHMVEAFLERQAGRYLKGAGSGERDMVSNLKAMLKSGEEESESLALTLMGQGGVPNELVGQVAARWVFVEEEPEGAKLERMLRESGHQKLVHRIKVQKRLKENLNYSWMQFLTRIAHYPEMDLGELMDLAMQNNVVPRKDAFHVKGIDLRPLIEQSIDKGELTLFNFHLGSFPREITAFEGLRRIYMMGNEIRSIPPEIGRLKLLKRLFLSTNHLQELPSEMAQLQQLEDLNLGSNRFRDLPPVIPRMQGLRRLELWNNPLRKLPAALAGLKNLRELDVGECSLGAIPEVVWALPQLEVLNLYSCRLTQLPAEAPQLPHLHFLNLGINQIYHLPHWLGDLPQLKTLILNKNPLKELPPTLPLAQQLRELWLPADLNWEQALPILKDLPGLTRLVLSGDHSDSKFNLWLQEQLPYVVVLTS